MRNYDIRTHRACARPPANHFAPSTRAHARQKLPVRSAISLRIAHACEQFRDQYAYARESLCSSTHAHARARHDRTKGRQNRFVTSTQARAQPEFREQYARPRARVEFLESIKRGKRQAGIVVSLFFQSIKRRMTAEPAGLSLRYFETHRARVRAHARENRRRAGPAVMASIARAREGGVFRVHKKGRGALGWKAGHA